MKSSAQFSPCGNYRYTLTRVWDKDRPQLAIVGLNPSTADAEHNDPTITKCIKLAKRWRYGGIVMVNLFAWRATDKSELKRVDDPVGPENDKWLTKSLKRADDVLLAWGNDGVLHDRSNEVQAILNERKKRCYCLKINQSGEPAHPLYQRDDAMLRVWGETSINEPMPWQMTVGELKQALADVPDDITVGVKVPPGTVSPHGLQVIYGKMSLRYNKVMFMIDIEGEA